MFKIDAKKRSFLDIEKIKAYHGNIVYGVPRETAKNRKDIEDKYANKTGKEPKYNNAELLALMEHGSIINNLPERKLLQPVREKYKSQIDRALLNICSLIIKGNTEEADKQMELLALRIEGWTKKFFTDPDNNWAPNAPITIYGGWMRNKKTGKVFYVKGKHSEKPLIDTGSLRASIKGIFYRESEQ